MQGNGIPLVLVQKSERVYVYERARVPPLGVGFATGLTRICQCMGVVCLCQCASLGIIDALPTETGVISTYHDALMGFCLSVKRRVFVHPAATITQPLSLTGHTPDTMRR